MVLEPRYESTSLKLLSPSSSHYAMLPSKGIYESCFFGTFEQDFGHLYTLVFLFLTQASLYLSSLQKRLWQWVGFLGNMPWFPWRKAARKCEVWRWWPFQGWVMNGDFLTFQATTSERKWNFPEAEAGVLCHKLLIWGSCLAFNPVINLEGGTCMLGFHLVSLKAYSFWFILSSFVQGCFIAKGWMTGFLAGCKDR